MYNDIYERVIKYAYYIIDNESTIRACAKYFGASKSSVHMDLKYRLPEMNYGLYQEVKKILQNNFNEKHIRGGESTRLKYLQISEKTL